MGAWFALIKQIAPGVAGILKFQRNGCTGSHIRKHGGKQNEQEKAKNEKFHPALDQPGA
jgi:hypothetical protein